jgi:NAD(P)-dependent dehydrogenase (short-subunit alcohol dehydrogenase family)
VDEFEDKVAVVTGGSSGIGRAAALALAQAGAKLVISDVNVDGGEETCSLIREAGGEAIFIEADVSQAKEVEGLMGAAVATFGRLDCAVNNAGVGGLLIPLETLEEPNWNQVIDVNLKGVWLCMKYEIPHLLASGGGAIVNIASAAGLVGFRYNAVYAASKHGVIGLTKSAALELAKKRIRVNAICPGFVDTPMVQGINDINPKMLENTVNAIPMKRLGKPEEIAEAVLWLCSEGSSFVTGHALSVDGGTVVQ